MECDRRERTINKTKQKNLQEEEKLRKATKERIKQTNDEKQKPNIKRCRLKKVEKSSKKGTTWRREEYVGERRRQTVNKHTPCLRFRKAQQISVS